MSKYVVTGGAGNVSRPLTELLLKAGNDVTVISRNPDNISGLVKQGATAAIGDLYDVPFLTETFEGADAVYLMSPTSWGKADLKQITIGKGLLFDDFFAGKHKHMGVSIEEYAQKFKAIYNSK
jgi:uncharacterized protein YbjT (DUF2867 family)